jgi:fructoselysine-6-P-deglycase FrlB-like protein/sugar/nucleoside kinase (ribokinase family)
VTPSGAPRVVIAGNLTLDDVVEADGHVELGVAGGNALYGALGARRWSASVGIVARAGEDAPAAALAAAGDAGVDLGGVVRVPGPTVRCWVLYEADGRRSFVSRTPPERYDEVVLRADDVPEAWLGAAAFHVAATRLGAAEALVARVRSRSSAARIVLDTHEEHVGDPDRVLALARQVDVFCPSREELAELAGEDEPSRWAPAFAGATGTPVIAKLGPDGCLVALPDGRAWRLASVADDVVDPTGAGDAFCGGVAAALAEGVDVLEAARRGSASAALAAGARGSARFARALDDDEPRLPDAVAIAPASAAAADGRDIRSMGAEIDTIPGVMRDQRELLQAPLAGVAQALMERGVERLALTGCGDSAFAGQAMALCIARHVGVDARAVHALDLCRYELDAVDRGAAVVCVSYSGQVGRTIEAALRARERGALTIALTGSPSTPLAGTAEHVLPLTVPTRGLSPGTSTYVAMLAAIAELAVRWATARGNPASELSEALDEAPALAAATLRMCTPPAHELGRSLAGARWVCFAGAGPNEASARFGAAKFLEGPQVLATATNVEEWAHEEYFVTAPGSPVVVVAPDGSSRDRVEDMLAELEGLEARTILVAEHSAPGVAVHLPLAAGLPEELTPLLAALPLSIVPFALAEMTGKRSYNFRTPEAERRHYETIHRLDAAPHG